ncbi:Villin-1 [Acorus calamus]|uniref:Villin-1 n=1 Tax=Acorus calamus TaxID=4465 RepID=A0AAV9E3B4_ACOCL|nr:Villin-1 [Acorus calamus]
MIFIIGWGRMQKTSTLLWRRDKEVKLDGALGSRAVQYREIQGFETEKFLSYFRPRVIPIEGVFSSELEGLNSKSYRVSLLACKGGHVIRIREVLFSRSSLNHDDVFVLDTESKIFLFCGCNSSTQERAKALEVVQYIKDNKYGGRCDMATIEDGKFVGDSDAGEFWSLFGGYAPIARDSLCSHPQQHRNNPSAELFWINKEKLCSIGTSSFKKGMLSMDKCYMLDCTAEIYIWTGRNTTITERKTAISATEDFVHVQDRSKDTHITFLTEGSETAFFKSHFDDWPQNVVPKLYEEGRGKVAAIFKRHGFDVKEIPDDDSDIHRLQWRTELMRFPTSTLAQLMRGNPVLDDLTTEEVLILDCHNEIYVWVGQHSSVTFKEAFEFGKKFLEADILSEGLSLEIAIYFVMEGDELPFFTRFFDWDFSKKHVHGNSFERKLTIMKGLSPNMEPEIGDRIQSVLDFGQFGQYRTALHAN